jgi:DNA-binding XRE family transcriptional regulator
MEKFLIYGLYCPFTGNLHYVGKSTTCLVRPMQHMTESHSEKINEWVSQLKMLNSKPIVKVLEECTENNLDEKEKTWIKKATSDGCYLLNIAHNSTNKITSKKEYVFDDNDVMIIAETIKNGRHYHNFTQDDVCAMARISRPTLSMIEKGNKKALYNNIKKVLNVLGYELTIKIKNNEKSTNIIT